MAELECKISSVFPGVFGQIMILFGQNHEILTQIMNFFKKFKMIQSSKSSKKRLIEMWDIKAQTQKGNGSCLNKILKTKYFSIVILQN